MSDLDSSSCFYYVIEALLVELLSHPVEQDDAYTYGAQTIE